MLSPARMRLPMNSRRSGGFRFFVSDEFGCCIRYTRPLLTQLAILAGPPIEARTCSIIRIGFLLATQTEPNTGHGLASSFGYRRSAFGTFAQGFTLPKAGAGTLHAVFNAGIDLVLNRPVARPTAGHQCASARSASALVACRVPSACSGGAYTVYSLSRRLPVLIKLCSTPASTKIRSLVPTSRA